MTVMPEDDTAAALARYEATVASLKRAADSALVRRMYGLVFSRRERQSPSVVVRGETEDTISLDLRGCCDRLAGPARAKLAELEGGSEVGGG